MGHPRWLRAEPSTLTPGEKSAEGIGRRSDTDTRGSPHGRTRNPPGRSKEQGTDNARPHRAQAGVRPPPKARTVGGDNRRGDPLNGKPAPQLWLPWTIEGKPSEEETTAECPSAEAGLMERVVERDNLFRALKQVQSHGGSPGRDGMTVEALAPYLKAHWPRLKQALLEGTYQPQPVKRGEVPKPQGGVRTLGVPTVVDRFIQQAVMQGLQAQWDPTFSDSSCRLPTGPQRASSGQAGAIVPQRGLHLGRGYGPGEVFRPGQPRQGDE